MFAFGDYADEMLLWSAAAAAAAAAAARTLLLLARVLTRYGITFSLGSGWVVKTFISYHTGPGMVSRDRSRDP